MNKSLSTKERQAIGNAAAWGGGLGVPLRQELFTTLNILAVGTAPLIVHNWSEKAKGLLRASHGKQPTAKREAKVPHEEFEAAKYRSADGWEGVPAHGLKGCFVEGARFVGGNKNLNMTVLKAALRVAADCPRSNLLRLYSPEPAVMREDLVRVGIGLKTTVDLRYRPEYWPWFVRCTIRFPSAMFSPEQIGDLIRAAGGFNGFCEWRPGAPKSLTGSYGTFEIADEATIAGFEKAFGVKV